MQSSWRSIKYLAMRDSISRTGRSGRLLSRLNTRQKSRQISMSLSSVLYMIEAQLLKNIDSLKSALTVPICYGFGIRWNEDPFIHIVRSGAAQRPKPPPTPISWSLAKVLGVVASIRVDCKDEAVLLRKQPSYFLWVQQAASQKGGPSNRWGKRQVFAFRRSPTYSGSFFFLSKE